MTDAPQTAPQPGIQIVSQYIKDFSFENPNAPESLLAGWPQPETSVNISLQQRVLKEDLYEAIMNLRVEAKKKGEDKTCFIADLSYAAVAMLQNIPAEQHQAVMMVEIPKLLFPFARAIIADAVSNAGYPPLFLAPISFEGLYINEMKRQQALKGASTAGAA